MTGSGEFGIIARYFAPLAKDAPLAFGLADDAAMLRPRKGRALVLTKDAIVAGVHFLPDDPPDLIARKLLRVNLSDLAAKGATPVGYLMATAFPKTVEENWIAAFAKGLARDQKTYGIHLLGGDTVATPGPATFSLTAIGETPARTMLRRSGAKPGDLVCVTGTIGDGGLGLAELRQPHEGLTPAQRRHLISRYRLPQPRTGFGAHLNGVASASLDISDGLIQDLGHIARQSGVRLVIDSRSVPLSPAALRVVRANQGATINAMTAGDDYEIGFTINRKNLKKLNDLSVSTATPVTVIGWVEQGQGVTALDEEGIPLRLPHAGFDHFR